MNRYIEKISKLNPVIKGALIGSGITGTLQYLSKPVDKQYTAKNRITDTITAASVGGMYGAALGSTVNLIKKERDAWRNIKHGPRESFQTYLKDIEFKGTPKTKTELHKHFKRQAMKHHPDRGGGNLKKMETINTAYTKIKAHPDFEKLASLNKYTVKVINLYV